MLLTAVEEREKGPIVIEESVVELPELPAEVEWLRDEYDTHRRDDRRLEIDGS